MPLGGLLGVLATPDAPLVFATLLALDAVLALRERVGRGAALQLAAGLCLGALSHYRFGLALVAGGAAVLVDARARRLLREPAVLAAVAVGAAAWWPALQWNLAHGDAGLRFHLLERNPWAFDPRGALWLPVQVLVVTPVLFMALLAGLRAGWRAGGAARLLAGSGGLAAPALLLLAFFVDRERVSFHWPLSGWLLLCPLAAVAIADWPRWLQRALWMSAILGLLAAAGFLVLAATPAWRERLADQRLYPNDVGGWSAVIDDAGHWPRDRPWIAADFELAAQLAFTRGRQDIRVLDSAINRKHGRAVQLSLWGRDRIPTSGPAWLVVEDTATPMKQRLQAYHRQCGRFGSLRPARTIVADHGRKRYFAYALDLSAPAPGCVAPALSWVDAPLPRARVAGLVEASGWAFKDGIGLRGVELTVDGRVVAVARYGLPMPGVRDYWRDSTDPHQPRVGWRAGFDASALAPGKHWLGLRLHAADGGVETAPEQSFFVIQGKR